jgi:TolB protein
MKKLVAALLVILCISLAACSSNKEKSDKTSEFSIYTNKEYGISLEYPSSWKPNNANPPDRFEGSDGFFAISAVAGVDSIDEVASWDAYHKLKPYGSDPATEKLTIAGQDARLILPSQDQSADMKGQASLIVRYPSPVTIKNQEYRYFVLWADKDHIKSIGETIKFIR